MGKTLVIAEKPKVAKELLQSSRFKGMKRIQGSKPYFGYFENDQYIVTWARGHLYEVLNPGDHDSSLKEFRFDNLPIILPVQYKMISGSEEQARLIDSLIKSPAVDSVVNACDNDKEGELLFREIYEASKTNKPVLRLWISSYELGDIEAGLNRLLDGKEFDSFADSARARQYLDHLVGDTITRASTVRFAKNKFLLSGGRVQLVLLNEIHKRQVEVENFKPKKFYQLFTDTGFLAQIQTEEEYILDPRPLNDLADRLKGQSVTVKDFKESNSKRNPPNLFNATDFLKACIQKLSLNAPQAKTILQELYEGGYVSYPRSDSRHLPTSMVESVKEVIESMQSGEIKQLASQIKSMNISSKHKSFDDEKVGSHFAIIPTKKSLPADSKEITKKVYDIIVKRFLSVFLDPAQYVNREIRLVDQEGNEYLAKEKILTEKGFLSIYNEDIETDEEKTVLAFSLPQVSIGSSLIVNDCLLKTGTTRNPGYHTETSILTFMETSGRNLVEDEQIKELLNGKRIGTPATAEAFIPKLIDRNYIVSEKGKLKTTSLGASFITVFPIKEIKDPLYTAEMEESIKRIEHRELTLDEFKQNIHDFVFNIVKEMAAVPEDKVLSIDIAHKSDVEICDCSCQRGKIFDKGKFYGCTNYPECTVSVPKVIKEKTLPISQVIKLLNNGETDVIKGFKDGEEKTFEAIVFFDNGKLKFKKSIFGTCPVCQKGEIKKHQTGEGKEFYGCSEYQNGCRFSLPSVIREKKLPEGQVRKLLKQQTTDFISGFISKEGKEFTARIILKDDGSLQFAMPTIEDKTIGSCPVCKGRVVIGKSYYLCQNYPDNCKFIISPVISKKKIPATQIQKLLEKNITDTIKGFHKKDDSGTFDAKITYDVIEKRLKFVFEKKKMQLKK